MLQFENAYFVDLDKGPVVDQLRKPMHYGNNKANRIGVTVTKNGQAVSLSGDCTGRIILGDESTVMIPNGVIEGNEAYIELTSDCYSVDGPIRIFMNIGDGTTETTLLDLTGYVKATQTESGAPKQIINIVAPMEVSSIASIDHAVGDYFIQNGALYEVTEAIEQGDVIIPGTNCQVLPNGLSGEFSEIKGAIGSEIGTAVEAWIEDHPDAVGYDDTEVRGLIAGKVNKPSTDGTSGQILKTNGDGTTTWADEYSYDDSNIYTQLSGKVNKPGTAGTAGKVLKCAGGNATVWADDTSTDPTKVAKPTTNPNGTSGQVLKTNGDGTTYWGNESSASDNSKVSKPTTNPDGTSGQVLKTNGNGTTAWVNVEDFNSLPILEASSSGDFNLADTNGNVVLRLENGHIKTQKFDSEKVKKPLEHYQSAVKSFVRGTVNTLTISHSFQKGERVLFHIEDDAVNWEYGHCADYYEGSNLIIAGRRGSQGYFEHVIGQNCQAVSVKLAQNEYTDGTDVRLHVYVVNGEVKPTVITVSADGKKMFTTLKAAVESIQDASSVINPYVIEVYPGEYNTLEGYSEEQIQSADTSGGGYTQDTFVGLKLTDGISIRGVGGTREKIILKAELSTTDYSSGVRGNISTLNIQGSGFIENMTIIGKNLRYCVHDDFIVPTNTHGWRRLKDLKFVGENLAYAPQFTTYGAGMATPRDYYIENCDFGFDLGIHSNNKYSFGCRIEAVHCTGHRFRIGDYASAEAEIPFEVYVNDCNFDIIRVNRANASLSSHVRLMGTGGAHSMIKTPDDEIYQLGMIDKTAAGFQKGTLLARVSGGASFAATQSIELACGVVIAADSNYSYIQREGYVASNMIGLTGLTLGGSVTVDSNNKLISGGSSGNRVGIVKAVDTDGIAYIHLWH